MIHNTTTFRSFISFAFLVIIFISCHTKHKEVKDDKELSEAQKREIQNALSGLDVHPDLELKLFANEPMLINPTNMDVDEKGRVWVTEAYNYRSGLNKGNKINPKGDRIVILEDTDGDGLADKNTVFYQGVDVNAALGICVLGNKVIVSCSPNVFLFTDENGDGVADKKELLFTGISGIDHDHAIHAFVFGPDGKLYFNFGNAGAQLKDKNGKSIIDKAGNEINNTGKPYRQGMVFRCNPDGSDVEVLANNFRNNYEVCVDAFGRMWQSDNDDDGNKGVRINYVLKYGNYGYTDQMTGASWETRRTNMEDSIPLRHWHLNDPGVVPNVLQTGAGSPCGITIYEGELLPKEFQGQMIHADAGPNVVRSYPITNTGSGYEATIVNLIKGERDNWFRPVDVCTAPDGSLMIADFYDPGVGGHQMGDQALGRIYRLAPKDKNYEVKKIDVSTKEGAIECLKSPNIASRYLGYNALIQFGEESLPYLDVMAENKNPRLAARALWLATKISKSPSSYVGLAAKNPNENMRIAAINMAEQIPGFDMKPLFGELANDTSSQVRREIAISLRNFEDETWASKTWNTLYNKYKSGDRWMLEALGIGADLKADIFFDSWMKENENHINSYEAKDVIWRSRSDHALPYIMNILMDPSLKAADKLKYFRALDFHSPKPVDGVLATLLSSPAGKDVEIQTLILNHVSKNGIDIPNIKGLLNDKLRAIADTSLYMEWIEKFDLSGQYTTLEKIMLDNPKSTYGRKSSNILWKKRKEPYFRKLIENKDREISSASMEAMRYNQGNDAWAMKESIARNEKLDIEKRIMAIDLLGTGWSEEDRLLQMLLDGKIPEELKTSTISTLMKAYKGSVRKKALEFLPKNPNSTQKPITELVELDGVADNGKLVYVRLCQNCHMMDGKGINFGPNLSEIGDKLSKEGLYTSVLFPNAGISFGYEGYVVKMKDGTSQVGCITSRTANAIDLKNIGGTTSSINNSTIASIEKMENSLMLEGLGNAMNETELIDLISYLQSLKKENIN